MQFDLVDAGVLAGLGVHAVEVFGQEVAHADGADQAAVARVQQGLECFDVEAALGVGPVDQVHVPVVEAGAHEGFFDGVDGLVVALVASGEFGDEAQLFAGDAAAAHGGAEGALVLVVEGAVQHAVSGVDARNDRRHARGAPQVVGPQRDRGNVQAVRQGVCGNLAHESSIGDAERPTMGGMAQLELDEVHANAVDYQHFLLDSPTPYHAAEVVAQRLVDAGLRASTRRARGTRRRVVT